MNLYRLFFTENACYKAGKTITPKGIMVHSTGADNPYLKRYVGPDDGLLGKNTSNNHWNQDMPEDRKVCVHAFIGRMADGSIATYQTLPWNYRGWHCGGSGNDTHIGFEICEDGLTDTSYFNAVYQEAIELCVYLCKLYGLSEKDIICHSEGYKQGIATNHSDVMHWLPKHGKSMETFRKAVKSKLGGGMTSDAPKEDIPTSNYPEKLTTGYYHVRKTWDDKKSQLGAYRVLVNAKAQADKNPGFYIFADDGTKIYPTGASAETYRTYTVVNGDSLWAIAQRLLGSGARYVEIAKLNGLPNTIINSGQILKIPN